MLWINERVKELTLTLTLEDKNNINTYQGGPSGLSLRAAGIRAPPSAISSAHTTEQYY